MVLLVLALILPGGSPVRLRAEKPGYRAATVRFEQDRRIVRRDVFIESRGGDAQRVQTSVSGRKAIHANQKWFP